ncbi:MAG: hypothetical protein A2849_03340 [Candidatus Taylorbacteria bacterium RIFCSPHIGHO2_01_FULL_51_15]|uniref:Uncharacterized protein n=1 Tax=Candidatus Taylorbacteria bacterium RIFCSPHIGHO2_01_FULL_51_15 TaxID=1802304 RepID=A0A1G2MC43_9BACT|nr:MAG: hypothetical protein A2849_03340 [Candidatus Taylorbacteria bacterium RIFCSPHIGHO2_01_FULL_51_15]
MDNDVEKIIAKAKRIVPSPDDRREMRRNVELFVKQYTVRNEASLRLLSKEGSEGSFFMRWWTVFTRNNTSMAIALLIALLVGGGTSFAAERSLPGETLYPIKVAVNEEVRGWFSGGSEGDAAWEARKAERRLEEAEALAREGNLSAEARADIALRLSSHASAFNAETKKLQAEGNTVSSLEAHSNFEASLKAHERILANLAEKGDTKELSSFLGEVRAKRAIVAEARAADEVKISADASGDFKEAAEGKLNAARNKLSEVRAFIASRTGVSANMEISSLASVDFKTSEEGDLSVAEAALARGEAAMEKGAYGGAFADFSEVIRLAQEAKLIVQAEQRAERRSGTSSSESRVKGEAEVSSKNETRTETPASNVNLKTNGAVRVDLGL